MAGSSQKFPRWIVVGLVSLVAGSLAAAGVPPAAQSEAKPATDSGAQAVVEQTLEAVAAPDAMDTVDTLHGAFLDVMRRAEELGFDGRLSALTPAVEDSLDLEYMALKTIGSRARKALGKQDRERWIASFSNFVLSNYARRFDGFSGQSFESLSEEPAPKKTVLVHTRLLRPNDKDVKLDYRLRRTKTGWRIIDIYSNGNVSEVALRYSEFSSLFENVGLDQLIASVDEKAARR